MPADRLLVEWDEAHWGGAGNAGYAILRPVLREGEGVPLPPLD
ncbi:MAG: hypothetical protein ABIR84_07330 [Candidatus Nitrotoga sp.]